MGGRGLSAVWVLGRGQTTSLSSFEMAPQKTKAVAISWLKKNLFAKLPESMIAINQTLRPVREHLRPDLRAGLQALQGLLAGGCVDGAVTPDGRLFR